MVFLFLFFLTGYVCAFWDIGALILSPTRVRTRVPVACYGTVHVYTRVPASGSEVVSRSRGLVPMMTYCDALCHTWCGIACLCD